MIIIYTIYAYRVVNKYPTNWLERNHDWMLLPIAIIDALLLTIAGYEPCK